MPITLATYSTNEVLAVITIVITAVQTMMLYTQVYRYDSPSPRGHCGIFGDPRVTTFDLIYYTTYLTGNFIYARSTSGLPFEV